MASVIGAIRTHIVTAIETTSITSCSDEYRTKRTVPPWAFIGWDTGDCLEADPNGVLTTRYPFQVQVTGSSVEQVDLACEEISILWYNAARHEALRLLGGSMCYPINIYPPTGKEGSKDYQGIIDMFVEIRRST